MILITRGRALRTHLKFNLVVRITLRTGFQRIINLHSKVISKKRIQDSPGNSNIKRCLLILKFSSKVIRDHKLVKAKNTLTLLISSLTTSIRDKRLHHLQASTRVPQSEINTNRNI
jgi:hypothetical protein